MNTKKFWVTEPGRYTPSGVSLREFFWTGYKNSSALAYLRAPAETLNPTPRAASNHFVASASPDWRDEAACADTNLKAFAPWSKEGYLQNQAWRPFCDSCPVTKQCLQFGRESDSEGVWGGVYMDGRGGEYDVESESVQISRVRPKKTGTIQTDYPRFCRGKTEKHLLNSDSDVTTYTVKGRGVVSNCKECLKIQSAKLREAKRAKLLAE